MGRRGAAVRAALRRDVQGHRGGRRYSDRAREHPHELREVQVEEPDEEDEAQGQGASRQGPGLRRPLQGGPRRDRQAVGGHLVLALPRDHEGPLYPGVLPEFIRSAVRLRQGCDPEARGPADLQDALDAHADDQRDRYCGLPAARLPGGAPARDPAAALLQPAHDLRADAVLDIAAGAHRGVDDHVAAGRRGERYPRLASPGRRREPAADDVQLHRHRHRHDADPAALHDPSRIQRDEGDLARLHESRAEPGRAADGRLHPGIRAAEPSGGRSGRDPRVHRRDWILHHPRARRRQGRTDDRQLHRLSPEVEPQLGARLVDGGDTAQPRS